MASIRGKQILKGLRAELRTSRQKLTKSMARLNGMAKKPGDKSLLQDAGSLLKTLFDKLNKKAADAEAKLQRHGERSLENMKKKVGRTAQLKSRVDAENLLLEIKQKELLEKSADIEAAYEKISIRNEELIQQKKAIDDLTEKLREKNEELELRADSLLDQTEYLHDANETIMRIHVELAQQKEQIEQKNEELLTLNNEKNNLIGIVAHDLKSPLNQIKGLVSLIRATSNLEGEAAACLGHIESSANRLSSMIAKILDIEAIESRQLNLKMEATNISEILSGVVSRFKIEAAQKSIRIHESIPSNIEIDLDKNYITQVLENLISNAIKFSPMGKNIWVKLVLHVADVELEIKDEGPGLTDDDNKKLFSKYQKLSAKPTGSESSTGLGLSIVKKFVESMNGKIWCESEAGKGASFFVRFPNREAVSGNMQ